MQDCNEGLEDLGGVDTGVEPSLHVPLLITDEPALQLGEMGEGGHKLLLDILGTAAVPQGIAVSVGCAGSWALSSSGHRVGTFLVE